MLKYACVFLGLLAASAAAIAGELEIGDPAPQLGSDVVWLKGEPVGEWAPGTVYLLDFWATWCGPCIAAMPHLSSLQDKYEDDGLVVLGLAVAPRPNMLPASEFVEKRGDRMRYRVGEGKPGVLEDRFMRPTGSNSLPTIMIVDQQGRLAWVGSPSEELDIVLSQVIEGTYDVAVKKKAAPILEEARRLWESGERQKAVEMLDTVVEMNPEMFALIAVNRYHATAAGMKDAAQARNYGRRLVGECINDNPTALFRLVEVILNEMPEGVEKDHDLALKAAERANELTEWKSAQLLDTLARARFRAGDLDGAIDAQKKAVGVLRDDADAATRRILETRLKEYELKKEKDV